MHTTRSACDGYDHAIYRTALYLFPIGHIGLKKELHFVFQQLDFYRLNKNKILQTPYLQIKTTMKILY